jgi:hypothetical protein
MVFFLTTGLISEIEANNNAVISAVELLALGRRHGRLVLTSSRELLKYLSTCEKLDKSSRGVFIYLYENYPINAIILQKISFYVEIVNENNHMEVKLNDPVTVLELSFDFIHDINIVNGTVVLAENQFEIDFYKIVCQCFKYNHDLTGLPSFCQNHMGGGNTTARIYNNFQNEKKSFCLCLADSDRKYPGASIGDTLNALLRIDDPNNYLCQIIGLESREVENLIPLLFLDKACENDVNYKNGFDSLSHIASTYDPSVLLFLDIKDGLSTKKYLTITDVNFKRFIDHILINSGLYSEEFLNDLKTNPVLASTLESLINGLGSNILDRSINKINESRNQNELYSYLLDCQLNEWERIGEVITNWTCSSTKLI